MVGMNNINLELARQLSMLVTYKERVKCIKKALRYGTKSHLGVCSSYVITYRLAQGDHNVIYMYILNLLKKWKNYL
jgi:hypothetical protein